MTTPNTPPKQKQKKHAPAITPKSDTPKCIHCQEPVSKTQPDCPSCGGSPNEVCDSKDCNKRPVVKHSPVKRSGMEFVCFDTMDRLNVLLSQPDRGHQSDQRLGYVFRHEPGRWVLSVFKVGLGSEVVLTIDSLLNMLA